MSKTKTIKQRSIYVYLPSRDMVIRWKTLAKKSGTSISKFVAEYVENSLRQEEDNGYLSYGSLIQETQSLKKALTEKDKRIRHLELLVEKLEQIQIRLGGNIQLLLRKIDNGIPSEGDCDLYPIFKIGK